MRAKSFLFVSLGILALATAFHLGATTATAQAPGNAVVGIATAAWQGTYGPFVATANGDIYVKNDYAPGGWSSAGNIFGAPTMTQQPTWGSVKRAYRVERGAARPQMDGRP